MPALLAASGVFARARLAEPVPPAGHNPSAEAPPVTRAGPLTLTVRADEVVLAGGVADEAERRALVDAVRAEATAHRVTDLLAPGGDRLPVPADAVADLVATAAERGVGERGAGEFTAVLASVGGTPGPARTGAPIPDVGSQRPDPAAPTTQTS
ncbi:hypothetical protein C8E97_2652 [Saccharothrix australiensis]|uniref:Uncharacterized protein n=1 Tax=Saccharothrix australiensis TaxID=2072 RepID=A0A495VZW1_9PSEU|nr:hypothetical protein C8E97_2652 [Saccharothrix australiensis]